MEWQAFLNRVVHARDFETVLLAWSVPLMPDPFTLWHSSMDKKGGFNFIGYASDRVDAIIDEAQSTVDRDQLDALFQRYHAEVMNDVPYLFLYSPNALSAVSRQLSPIEPTLMGYGHNRFDWRLNP
jgi:peptide/nickel transport system substrate-binding protein